MSAILSDLRFALRQLRKSPGFTLTALLTLALGLGAGSVIFCLMDSLWLHPMQVQRSRELTRIFATSQQSTEGLFSYPEYMTMAQRLTALKGTIALGRRGAMVPRADGTSELLLANVVSANFFEVLGIQPKIGRVFKAQDAATLRAHPGVLLGYRRWQRGLGGDPAIVGRQITLLRGQNHRSQVDIWGVLPAEFREIDSDADRDLWMAAESWAAVATPADLTSTSFRWFNVLGRLAPGATVAQLNEQAAAVGRGLEAANPADNRGRGARAVSDFHYRMDRAGTTGLALFAIVAGVIVLATVNLAHLLLARALGASSA